MSDLTPVDVEQPPGAAGVDVEILVPRLGRLEGRVVDTLTSAAIPSFTIWLRRLEGGDVTGMNLNLTVMPRSFVSSDGSFVYEGLPPGRFALVLVAERRPVHFEEVEVAGGNSTSLLVHLPRGRRVAGKVVDRESGEPVPSAQVFVRTRLPWESTVPAGTPYTAFTAGDGTFVIDGVEGQKITVEAFHPGFTRKTQGLDLGESGEVPPVELRLRPAGSFEGKIANVLGRQCLWRWLELTPLEDSTREPTRHMLDNAREELHFEGIRAGRYTISLGEDRLRPGLPAEQTSFGREEMETVEIPLGEISIEPRQTTHFEAIAPPEPARRQ